MAQATCIFSLFLALFARLSSTQSINPTILQDTRDLPKTDGTFGFLYRTEDGIAHAAKADQQGIVHGRYTYTDPTGLKVNFNYNAGSRVRPGYNYENAPQPPQRAPIPPPRRPRPVFRAEPQPEEFGPVEVEQREQVEYVPRSSPQRRPRFNPRYVAQEENNNYRRPIGRNEVYDYDY